MFVTIDNNYIMYIMHVDTQTHTQSDYTQNENTGYLVKFQMYTYCGGLDRFYKTAFCVYHILGQVKYLQIGCEPYKLFDFNFMYKFHTNHEISENYPLYGILCIST